MPTSKLRRAVSVAVGVACFATAGRAAADAVPACTTESFATWKTARLETLGVRVTDRVPLLDPDVVPSGSQSIESSCPSMVDFALDQDGRASDGFHSWVFGNPCKQTLCGEPVGYEENRGGFWFSGEFDMNNNLSMDKAFRQRNLEPLLCYRDLDRQTDSLLLAPEEPHLCFPPTEHIHVEITPPPRLRPLLLKAWTPERLLGWQRWKSSLLSVPPTLCVYGPFVADTGHAARAEIHPTQLVWWRETQPALPPSPVTQVPSEFDRLGRLALFAIQDASGRYTRRHHFVLSRAPAQGSPWKPWASAPLDGTFEIPFWSDPASPPHLRLEPYSYLGVGGGAPDLVAADPQRFTAQVAGVEQTVATVSNKTRARPPSKIGSEVQVLCTCTGDEACAGRKGFLAKMTIRVETGRAREWSEGSQALLLTDDEGATEAALRPPAVPTDETRGAPPPAPTPSARSIVTWRPARNTRDWLAETPSAEELAAVRKSTDAIFDEAGWPDTVARPLPSLWRMSALDVTADAVVEGLPERHRKSRKVEARFEVRAVELLSGTARALDVTPIERRRSRVAIARNGPATTQPVPVERLEVSADVQVSYRDDSGTLQKVTAQGPDKPPGAEERAPGRPWIVWTHAFGTEPLEHWQGAVRALCEFFGERGPGDDAFRVPQDDLRIILRRALKGGVITVTDLRTIVADVRTVCGRVDAEPRQARPYPVQSR